MTYALRLVKKMIELATNPPRDLTNQVVDSINQKLSFPLIGLAKIPVSRPRSLGHGLFNAAAASMTSFRLYCTLRGGGAAGADRLMVLRDEFWYPWVDESICECFTYIKELVNELIYPYT